jgi:Cu(I)/Ag(I) efflux system membrane fusion protein
VFNVTTGQPIKTKLGQTILYTCPMHPQVISKKPGVCPICGMTLVVKGG